MSHLLVKCCKIKTYARWFSSLNSVVSYSCKLNLLHVVSMNWRIYICQKPPRESLEEVQFQTHLWLCRLFIPSFEGIEYIIAVSWSKRWSMEVSFFLICYTNISVDILSSPSSLIQRLTLRVVLDFLENSARTAVSDHFGMKVFTEMRYPWFQTGSNPLC